MAGQDKGVTDLTFALPDTRSATGLCPRGGACLSRYGPLTLGRPPKAAWAADRGDAVPDPGGNGLDAEAQPTG